MLVPLALFLASIPHLISPCAHHKVLTTLQQQGVTAYGKCLNSSAVCPGFQSWSAWMAMSCSVLFYSGGHAWYRVLPTTRSHFCSLPPKAAPCLSDMLETAENRRKISCLPGCKTASPNFLNMFQSPRRRSSVSKMDFEHHRIQDEVGIYR